MVMKELAESKASGQRYNFQKSQITDHKSQLDKSVDFVMWDCQSLTQSSS